MIGYRIFVRQIGGEAIGEVVGFRARGDLAAVRFDGGAQSYLPVAELVRAFPPDVPGDYFAPLTVWERRVVIRALDRGLRDRTERAYETLRNVALGAVLDAVDEFGSGDGLVDVDYLRESLTGLLGDD